MDTARIDDIETVPIFSGDNSVRHPVSPVIEGMEFGMVQFELAPGEATGGAPHTHLDQEELFYVLDGEISFSVRAEPTDDPEVITVRAGEVIHFTPDDVYQQGVNQSDEPVVVLGVGVPGARHDWSQVRTAIACPDCGHETVHRVVPKDDSERMPDPEGVSMICTECDGEH
jgi:quercetin dioxygenase-like cupin family protein